MSMCIVFSNVIVHDDDDNDDDDDDDDDDLEFKVGHLYICYIGDE